MPDEKPTPRRRSRSRKAEEPTDDDNPFSNVEDEEQKPQSENPFAGAADDPAKEKAPRSLGPRQPTADLLTMAWGGLGMFLIRTQTDVPVGRVMQFQAPLAGKQIDELIAHTWLDAILQPLARQADKLEGLGAVIGLPLLIGAYERNAEFGAVAEPIIRELVHQTLTDMAPVIRKKQSDARKAAKALDPELFGLEPGQDPVEAVLASIFAPIPGMEDQPPYQQPPAPEDQ